VLGALLAGHAIRGHVRALGTHLRAEQQRAADLGDFAGRVAHDVLNPLMNISLSLETLRSRATASDEVRRSTAIERGVRSVERMKRIITDLLTFSRAGGVPDLGARSGVAEVLQELKGAFDDIAQRADVALSITSEAGLTVVCAPGVLTIVVQNLVQNAIKYTEGSPQRRVAVRAFCAARAVRIEVADTGPGIETELCSRIFEPYVRAKEAAQLPGLGLGLATVKRLVESHRGSIGVHSEMGRGSLFWVEFPPGSSGGCDGEMQLHSGRRGAERGASVWERAS
jgi:signal transduction histidine kinase